MTYQVSVGGTIPSHMGAWLGHCRAVETIAEPLEGAETVLVYADWWRAELAGECGACGTLLGQSFALGAVTYTRSDRRLVMLGQRAVRCVHCHCHNRWGN